MAHVITQRGKHALFRSIIIKGCVASIPSALPFPLNVGDHTLGIFNLPAACNQTNGIEESLEKLLI